jgi:Putative transposase/Transposase zinc-binding domain
VAACRTAALGGHVRGCGACGHREVGYNSCRNRHCPRCQAGQRAAWLEREAGWLLPVAYHHVVFTLPAALAELARRHPATIYNLLFESASGTIRQVAADPKHLGAQAGLLLVLHTWGQNLRHHPHVHGIVTGGGLACDARGNLEATPRWVSCRPGFFLPVRVLSRVYRGKFLAGLRAAYTSGKLTGFADAAAFEAWLSGLVHPEWVVYAQPPAAGPVVVLKYLARYVHRVALAESRLVRADAEGVTFTWKDYADGGRVKEQTLSGVEFLRRWLMHVLPRGFVKVRHYGLLANRHRDERLALCRRLLWPAAAAAQPAVEAQPAAGRDSCPKCGSRLAVVLEWPKGSAGCPAVCRRAALDSS